MGIKLLIAGSRDYDDYDFLKTAISELNQPIDYIISGTARGADQLGERYAKENNIEILRYPADWDIHGKKAGFIRNQKMGEVCDLALLFWDCNSPGTRSMIYILNKLGKRYILYKYRKISNLRERS